MWLLLVEDERRLSASLKEGLQEVGYVVDVAYNGIDGESLGLANAYDALIVDWRLPDRDGRTVVENLRNAGRPFPILMLTALGDLEHRVAGLDAGADDYLSKPFKFEELQARLRALLRRPPLASQEHVIRLGALELNAKRREVVLNGTRLDLRPKEFSLLEDLLRHRDEVLSRTVIAERVWGDPFYVTDNVIDVTISSLRQKLAANRDGGSDEHSIRIETIRGVGYRLENSEKPSNTKSA